MSIIRKPFLFGLALIVLGCVVFGIGYAGAGGDLSVLNGDIGPFTVYVGGEGSVETQEYTIPAAELTYISLLEDNGNLVITRSPDKDVHFIAQETERRRFELSHQGDTLTIQRSNQGKIGLVLAGMESLTSELQIPKNLSGELRAETINGRITAENLRLSVSGSAEFLSSNGAVTLKNLRLGDLRADSSNGSITADGIDCAEAVLVNNNGKITLDTISALNLRVETNNGAVMLSDADAVETLVARTSNGSVTVERVGAGESIDLRSDNGSIRGTLAGQEMDYTIRSGTDLGDNNLPTEWGRGDIALEVFTSNGSIEITFAEE